MPTRGDGVFTYEIPSTDLIKGLRINKNSPRNSKFLAKCQSAIGLDGGLQVLPDETINLLNTIAITDGFPYPQLFVCVNMIVVCGKTTIYELEGSTVTQVLTGLTAGIPWSLVDYFDLAYASNGQVVAKRDPLTRTWSLDSTGLPTAGAACDFNGQLVIGAPNAKLSIKIPGHMIQAESIIVETFIDGSYVSH
jgi:hypothetical protein